MKKKITKQDVAQAIKDLEAKNKKPTLQALYIQLGQQGSMSTLHQLKTELDVESKGKFDSEELMTATRNVMALALDSARKMTQQELAECRDDMAAISSENERIEGTIELQQDKLALLQTEKDKLASELVQVQTKLTDALQKLNDAQAAHSADTAALVKSAHEKDIEITKLRTALEAQRSERSERPERTAKA
jgi:predicted nuclease with TOPRIM domain